MKTNLKTFPETCVHSDLNDDADTVAQLAIRMAEIAEWKKAFAQELRFIDFSKWFEDNKLLILEAFELHSHDGLTPNEVLRYFVQKEVLGE